MQIEPLDPGYVAELVAAAIDEDRATDDVTTLATVPEGLQGRAVFLAKQPGVAAGLGIAQAVFRDLSLVVAFEPRVGEGERFAMGAELAIVEARAQALLQGERVALNFLQRLCATATLTRQFVDAIAGTRAVILDTRKTTPGLRDAEKYAVRCGGGTNHRRDLASMAMLKDNHLAAIARSGGSIADAVTAVREFSPGIAVEVEIDGLDQLEAALAAAPEWILLDNMPVDTTREAVVRTAGRAKLEASGGVNLSNVRAIAETGVDAISVGALTHSAGSLDISMELTF